jgi:DNA polymerase III epsilon subunit-like protein
LPYIRTHFKSPIVENHKLSTLASHFGLNHEHAHDALSDSIVLKQICEAIVKQKNIDYTTIFGENYRPFSAYIEKILYGKPLQPLRKKKKRIAKEKHVTTDKLETSKSENNVE